MGMYAVHFRGRRTRLPTDHAIRRAREVATTEGVEVDDEAIVVSRRRHPLPLIGPGVDVTVTFLEATRAHGRSRHAGVYAQQRLFGP